MNGKKRAAGILERVSRAADIPPEIAAGTPKLILSGCGELYIEGHSGLVEYGGEKIVINCGRYLAEVRGTSLGIKAMNADELVITGTLFGVEYIF